MSAAATPAAAVTTPAIRLKDVAAAGGVSVQTVSLALRNHTSIPPGTRARIQKLAAKLGYRPDPNISQLMERVRGKKPSAIGTVLAYLTAHRERLAWKREPTQRDYHDGAFRRATELGYQLEEFWLRAPDMTEERLSRILRNRGIEGAIIAPLQNPGHLFQKFQWKHFSVVELGYSLLSPVLHRCCNQQFQSMTLLLRRLREAGYQRMGLAMAPGQDERVNHHWRAAYLTSQSLMGLATDSAAPTPDSAAVPMFFGNDATWTRPAFATWLRTHEPDVIVTVGTDIQRWLTELGLRTPTDVALANVDLNETMPGITGINQNALQVGAASVDLLLSQMRTGERGLPGIPRTLMVDGDFVQGTTTRPAPAKRTRARTRTAT
ncbi:LacI family transcriptional regulator [Opitutaceae bacterium TAV4]|nr:LacI family transcriptional regulator [Opitutaceae bacterium TAV3]RRK01402.1 LacI family transcriptional regulator [Opitutaceae bacterium TAV4]